MITEFKTLYHDSDVDNYFKYAHEKYPVKELMNDKKYMESDVAKGYITYLNGIDIDVFFEVPLRLCKSPIVSIYEENISRDKAIYTEFLTVVQDEEKPESQRMERNQKIHGLFWKYDEKDPTKALYLLINDWERFNFLSKLENLEAYKKGQFYMKRNCPPDTFRGELFFYAVLPVKVVDKSYDLESDGYKLSIIKLKDRITSLETSFSNTSGEKLKKERQNPGRNYGVSTRGALNTDINTAIYERHNGWFYNVEKSDNNLSSYYNIISHINDRTRNGMVVQKKYSINGIAERTGSITNNIVRWSSWKSSFQDFHSLKNIFSVNNNYLTKVPVTFDEYNKMALHDASLSNKTISQYMKSGKIVNEYVPKYGFYFKDIRDNVRFRKGIHTLEKRFIYSATKYIEEETEEFPALTEKYPIYDDYVYDKENQTLPKHMLRNEYPENYMFRYLGQVEYKDRDGNQLTDEEVDRLFKTNKIGWHYLFDVPQLWRWLNNSYGREFIITSRKNPIINGYFVKKPGVRINIPGSKKERLGILKVYTYPQRKFEYKNHRITSHPQWINSHEMELEKEPKVQAERTINKFLYPRSFEPEYKKSNPRDIPQEYQEYFNGDRISRMYIYQELPVNKDYFIRGSGKIKGSLKSVTEKQLTDELSDTLHYSQYINNIFDFDHEFTDLSIGPVNFMLIEGEQIRRSVDDTIDSMSWEMVLPPYENPRDEKHSTYPYNKTSYSFNNSNINLKEEGRNVVYDEKPRIEFNVTRLRRMGWIDHKLFAANDRIELKLKDNINFSERITTDYNVSESPWHHDFDNIYIIPKPEYEGLE